MTSLVDRNSPVTVMSFKAKLIGSSAVELRFSTLNAGGTQNKTGLINNIISSEKKDIA